MTNSEWKLDPVHSGINFTVRHMVVSKVRGRFTKVTANLGLDDADLTRSTIDASIDAASIDTGNGQRDGHLRSPDFLDAQRFPEIRFRSTHVHKVADDRYHLRGDLTIRDVTRPILLDVEYGGRAKDPWGNERVGFIATGSLDRKDFGLQWNQVLETGGVLVGDRVDIELEIQGVRAAAQAAA